MTLSNIMFICTANVLHTVPQALRDRMEVLQLAGYTEFEKIEIARTFLTPKAVKAQWADRQEHPVQGRVVRGDHPAIHARGRGPQSRAGDQRDLP